MLVPRRVASNSHPTYHSTGLRVWGNYLPLSFELADSQQFLIINMFDNILCRFLRNRYLMTIRYHVSKLPISPLIHVNTAIAQICPNDPWPLKHLRFSHIFSASGFDFHWPYFCDPTNLKATATTSHPCAFGRWRANGRRTHLGCERNCWLCCRSFHSVEHLHRKGT